jgi:hypothetical protein
MNVDIEELKKSQWWVKILKSSFNNAENCFLVIGK